MAVRGPYGEGAADLAAGADAVGRGWRAAGHVTSGKSRGITEGRHRVAPMFCYVEVT